VIVVVTMLVEVTMTMVVKVGIHLYFRTEGWGKERGSYPPSGWCERTRGFGTFFKLGPKNQGVVPSFWLKPENLGSCIFL